MLLIRWGWDTYFEELWSSRERNNVQPARVIGQQRRFWRVAGKFGECWAEADGKLRFSPGPGVEWPAVGDWVAVELPDHEGSATIRDVLPRRSRFTRKVPGKKIEQQVLAANVDIALLVCALDGDFNTRRVERYLAQVWESGARPVILLNKSDVCPNVSEKVAEIEKIAQRATVCVVSARTGEAFKELENFLAPGITLALLGSSGAGKSTITNRLLGQAIQQVQAVRECDNRGRHTTTTRELFLLPGGALLIDAPGLRELQLWDAGDGVSKAFADIEALAGHCRFRDCRHEAEPGCAVQAAIAEGTLELERFENRRKLLREEDFLRRKMDPEVRHEEKQQIRKLFRQIRQKTRYGKREPES
jgi:ribosome biogenesis GTPase / thiamine phosphate phosphatase